MDEEHLMNTYSFVDGFLISNKTGKPIGTLDKRGKQTYLSVKVKGKRQYVHRILFWFYHGYWPELIDHDDQNGLNNTKANLIDRTHSQNHVNASIRTDNKSGYTGVIWHKKSGKWAARFKRQHLGLFDNIEDAIRARDKAEYYFWNPNNTLFEEA